VHSTVEGQEGHLEGIPGIVGDGWPGRRFLGSAGVEIAEGPPHQAKVADVLDAGPPGSYQVRGPMESGFFPNSAQGRGAEIFVEKNGLDDGPPQSLVLGLGFHQQVLGDSVFPPKDEDVHLVTDSSVSEIGRFEWIGHGGLWSRLPR